MESYEFLNTEKVLIWIWVNLKLLNFMYVVFSTSSYNESRYFPQIKIIFHVRWGILFLVLSVEA